MKETTMFVLSRPVAIAATITIAAGIVCGGSTAEAAQASSESTSAVMQTPLTKSMQPLAPGPTRGAAGKYDYTCVLSTGGTYAMPRGAKTTDCHGTFLQQYMDGKLINNVKLTPTGVTSNTSGFDCALSIAGSAWAVLTKANKVKWVVGAVLSAVGFVVSCVVHPS